MHISISVIISVFNGERYIKRCIRSVLNQTYNVKELIIYDDASTDNTFKIIETCVDESKAIPIKLYSSTYNRGPGGGKMYALGFASGEYILFLDADDYLDKDYVEQVVNEQMSSMDILGFKPDIVFTGFRQVDEEGKKIYVRKFDTKEKALYGAISNWGKLWRRSFLIEKGIEIPSGAVLDDVLTRAVVIGHMPKISLCKDCVGYNYVKNSLSVSNTYMKHFISGIAEKELSYLYRNKGNIEVIQREIYVYWVYKIFCWHMLKSGTKSGKKQMEQEYNTMHDLLMKYFPEYVNNAYLKGKKLPERVIIRLVVCTLYRLERMHLQRLFFYIYSVIDLSWLWPKM